MLTILMVLASENFRDTEYIVPRAFWEQQGFEVETTSIEKVSVGRFGYRVEHEKTLEGVSAGDYDGIFFVGGTGALDYLEDERAKALTQDFIDQEKAVGAICAACRLLIIWGFLKGKKATGHNWDGGMKGLCIKHGAQHVRDMVVRDGLFVTGYGPEQAEEVAREMGVVLSQ